MRLLVVFEAMHPPSYRMLGGTSILYDNLKCLTKQKDVELHVLTSIYPQASKDYVNWFKKQKKEGIVFHHINLNKRVPKRLLFSFYKMALFFKVLKLNKRYKFDIIHEYSSSPILCLRTGLIGKLSRAKTVHTICTYNDGFFGSYKFVRLANLCDKIVVLTKSMEKNFIKIGVKKQKVELIPLGVDYDKFNIKRKRVNNKQFKLLFLGPFIPRKGIFTFIKAANKLIEENKGVKFVLGTHDFSGLGSEGNQDYIKKLITKNKDSFKIMIGKLDVLKLMLDADLLVVPQDSPHGTLAHPLTILEAMSNGLPVVASNTEGVNDLIKNNENGFLFKPKDPASLYNVLKKTISNKPFTKRLGLKGKLNAKKFNYKLMSNKLYSLYLSLMS